MWAEFWKREVAAIASRALGKCSVLVLDLSHEGALADTQGGFHGIIDASTGTGLDDDAIDDSLDGVFLAFVEGFEIFAGQDLSIDA